MGGKARFTKTGKREAKVSKKKREGQEKGKTPNQGRRKKGESFGGRKRKALLLVFMEKHICW